MKTLTLLPVLLLSLPAAQAQAQDLAKGLLGYWRMDEAGGETVKDSGAAKHNGAVQNYSAEVWEIDGARGRVFHANGDAFIDFGEIIPVQSETTDFTWSLWVKSEETSNNNIVFGNRWDVSGVDFAPREFIKFTPSKFEWHFDGAGQDADGDDLPVDVWSHQLVIKKGTSLTYLRDGQEIATSEISGAPVNPQPLYLGGQNNNERWRGLADEVAIYNRALTAAEAAQVFALGKANKSLIESTGPLLASGAVTVRTREQLTIEYTNSGTSKVDTKTIVLKVDGATVSPTITPNVIGAVITYKPAAPFAHGSKHTYEVTAKDTNGANVGVTGDYTLPAPAFPEADINGPKPADNAFGVRYIWNTGVSLGWANVFQQIDAAGKAGFKGKLFDTTHATLDYGNGGGFSNNRAYPSQVTGDANWTGDDFIQLAVGHIEITQGGNYTFGVQSDDGFGLRLKGVKFTAGGGAAKIDPLDSSAFIHPADTGNSNSHVIALDLKPGVYRLEWFWWERAGGDFGELYMARGEFTAFDQTETWTLIGDAKGPAKLTSKAATGPSGGGGATATGLAAGLRGYWRFEETSGEVVKDSSPRGNNGTVINPSPDVWVKDAKRGQVFRCDGQSFVDFGTIMPILGKDSDFTWSMWTNSDETANNNIVFGNRFNRTGADFSPREFIKFTPSKFEWHFNAAGQDADGDDMPTGEWVHNLVVKKGSEITYYRNGLENAVSVVTGGPRNPQPLYLGGQNNQERWSGLADEIAIWERALSAAEQKELFEFGKTAKSILESTSGGNTGGGNQGGGAETGLAAGMRGYWRFEETSGSVVSDSSSKGNNGRVVNPSNAVWEKDAKRGQVFRCDGTSFIDFGTIMPVLGKDSDFTWSLWVNSDETANNNIVFGNRYNRGGADFSPREFIKFTPSKFEWHFNGAGQDADGEDMPTGEWIHNLVVKKGAEIVYYRNGEENARSTVTSGPRNPQPLYLGGQSNQERWSGLADEVAIWERALTEAERKQVYELGKTAKSLLTGATNPGGGTTTAKPILGKVTRSGSGTAVSVTAAVGAKFDLEYSQDLKTWEAIAPNLTGTGQAANLEDTDAARRARRAGFYRARVK